MSVDWQLDHVGLVIKDMDAAIRYYDRMGIKLSSEPEKKTIETQSTKITFESCNIENNALRIKLILTGQENGLFSDYLKKYGEGVSYAEFRVNDLQKEKEKLTALGVSAIGSTKNLDGSDMEIFFDTRQYGNVIVALFSEPVSFPVFKPSEGSWKFLHLGFIVKDIFKFVEFYRSLGFDIRVPPRKEGNQLTQDNLDRWTIYGKVPQASTNFKMIVSHFQNNQEGTFHVGVNEPAGNPIYEEFMKQHGEGVEHLHFLVEDLPKELANMVSLGFPCILTQKTASGILRESMYDTREIGNVAIALMIAVSPFAR